MALGEFEQLVMLAILHLDNRAYGVEIVDTVPIPIDRAKGGKRPTPQEKPETTSKKVVRLR